MAVKVKGGEKRARVEHKMSRSEFIRAEFDRPHPQHPEHHQDHQENHEHQDSRLVDEEGVRKKRKHKSVAIRAKTHNPYPRTCSMCEKVSLKAYESKGSAPVCSVHEKDYKHLINFLCVHRTGVRFLKKKNPPPLLQGHERVLMLWLKAAHPKVKYAGILKKYRDMMGGRWLAQD
jgi:hypothetical protein